MSISPPPYREKDLTSQPWQKWFSSLVSSINSLAASTTTAITNLTDIATRKHSDLQDLNTQSYSHLSGTQRTALIGSTDTDLHFHSSDRALANATGVLATTNGGTGITSVGTNGQVLTSNGTNFVMSNPSAAFVINESDITIAANYTITTGKSGLSVSPVLIADSVVVTIPTGSIWAIVA